MLYFGRYGLFHLQFMRVLCSYIFHYKFKLSFPHIYYLILKMYKFQTHTFQLWLIHTHLWVLIKKVLKVKSPLSHSSPLFAPPTFKQNTWPLIVRCNSLWKLLVHPINFVALSNYCLNSKLNDLRLEGHKKVK